MIITKVYIVPSGGEGAGAPQPPKEIESLCDKMRQRSPNWGYRTDVPMLDEAALFEIASSKYSLAGGLPIGFRIQWDSALGHSVNPLDPTQWIHTPLRASLRFTVKVNGKPDAYVFVLFEQPDWAGAAGSWEEAPVLP